MTSGYIKFNANGTTSIVESGQNQTETGQTHQVAKQVISGQTAGNIRYLVNAKNGQSAFKKIYSKLLSEYPKLRNQSVRLAIKNFKTGKTHFFYN